MNRLNDYYEFALSGHWLTALVNGDETGLSANESADLAVFMKPYDALPDITIEVTEEEPCFRIDDISEEMSLCYTVRFHFTNHALTPQQHALDLN